MKTPPIMVHLSDIIDLPEAWSVLPLNWDDPDQFDAWIVAERQAVADLGIAPEPGDYFIWYRSLDDAIAIAKTMHAKFPASVVTIGSSRHPELACFQADIDGRST